MKRNTLYLLSIVVLQGCSQPGAVYDDVCDNPELSEELRKKAMCQDDMSRSDTLLDMERGVDDLTSTTSPDMNRQDALSLTATQEGGALAISWPDVDGAEFYEIKVDNRDWIRIGDTPGYLDGMLEHNTGSAVLSSNAELVREKISLSLSDIELMPSRERRYEVRAMTLNRVLAQGTIWASHQPELVTSTLLYSDDQTDWKKLVTLEDTSSKQEDLDAPLNGDVRYYKTLFTLSNGLSFESNIAEGQRLAAIKVDAMEERTCVLFNNEKIRCFGGGAQTYPILGYGDILPRGGSPDELPTPYVDVGVKVKDFMLNSSVNCVLSSEQGVVCWGWRKSTGNINTSEFLGDEEGEMPPEPFVFNKPIQALSSTSGGKTVCAITDMGEVTCWSSLLDRGFSLLGYEDMESRELPPFEYVDLGRPIKEVITLTLGTCALALDGTIMCWGSWLLDQTIGDKPGDMPPPILDILPRQAKIISMSGGSDHACVAIEDSTEVYCWGDNQYQQLGHNDDDFVGNSMAEFPVRGVSLAESSFVKQVVAGSAFSAWTCGLLDNGNVTCWGYNADGRLGYVPDPNNEVRTRRNVPLDLGGKAVQIAAGSTHVCALMRDAEIKCWGRNDFGQLGVGHTDIIGDDEGEMPPANAIIYE